MAIRQSVLGLSRDPRQLGLVRRAYRRFQSWRDDRGYQWFAQIHGFPLAMWCHHGTELFLPWHRAFLYYFELGLQSRLGPRLTVREPEVPAYADVGVPWWDWASDESHRDGLPMAFLQPMADGEPNPLHASRIAYAGDAETFSTGVWSNGLVASVRDRVPGAISDNAPPRTVRDTDEPVELPRQHTLDNLVLTRTTFEEFSNSLEAVHDDVHAWVGGSMSIVPTAAFDPVFWSHHAMIDRVWAMWQSSGVGEDPPAALLDTVLAPFPLTVRDTLRIRRLGYDYAVQASG